jgi:hypothetical protein
MPTVKCKDGSVKKYAYDTIGKIKMDQAKMDSRGKGMKVVKNSKKY